MFETHPPVLSILPHLASMLVVVYSRNLVMLKYRGGKHTLSLFRSFSFSVLHFYNSDQGWDTSVVYSQLQKIRLSQSFKGGEFRLVYRFYHERLLEQTQAL